MSGETVVPFEHHPGIGMAEAAGERPQRVSAVSERARRPLEAILDQKNVY